MRASRLRARLVALGMLTAAALAPAAIASASTTVTPAGATRVSFRTFPSPVHEAVLSTSGGAGGSCDLFGPWAEIPAVPDNHSAFGPVVLPVPTPATSATCSASSGPAFTLRWTSGWSLAVTHGTPILAELTVLARGLALEMPSISCQLVSTSATTLRGTWQNGTVAPNWSSFDVRGTFPGVWTHLGGGTCAAAGLTDTIAFSRLAFQVVYPNAGSYFVLVGP